MRKSPTTIDVLTTLDKIVGVAGPQDNCHETAATPNTFSCKGIGSPTIEQRDPDLLYGVTVAL
jgi:hypothetical protein